MTTLRAAISFLTILPLPGRVISSSSLSASRAFFPLVGLALGVPLALADAGLRHFLPTAVTSALLLAALFLLTRVLHIDGLLDTLDGVLGGHTRERKLAIMCDPKVGAFAVAGALCVFLVTWSALTALAPPARVWTIAVFPALSRWAMIMSLSAFPYARTQGLGSPFAGGPRLASSLFALGTTLAASFLLAGWGGLLLLGAASACAAALGLVLTRILGGLTGDTYGAVNEITQMAVLVVALGLRPLDWLRPVTQL
ncbi:MAG: adenosylcobinamide-GDP ribazoletransferase [Dehalococcoidia bacterium]|nr:adenosylcobinamide-GDP ribazoletransferase [Dehalococcoidia bacterium]